MKKTLLVAVGMMLVALPAYSQSSDDSGDRGSSYGRQDRDLDDLLRGLDSRMSARAPQRGAGFLLRAGDATLAVRCDPRDSMRACVDAATTLMERARTTMPSGSSPGGSPPGATPSR
ncbi:hypothetical protein [Microvirga mediterraneensis]|uniref:UrcA family protein n=1 Tax=Microvirga mediterraneensis TaxID=2754695 RepID=A0A838BMD3_9HYPH|nr:hypothetical protein [Microvirga mediterraneensis]MBA1156834.1 hypothetical protein [Microvirga mediterraneensis]